MKHPIHDYSSAKIWRMILFGIVFVFLLFTQKVTYAQTESGSFKFDGDLRSYKVFFPADYSTDKEFPVVFYLHCYGFYGSWERPIRDCTELLIPSVI